MTGYDIRVTNELNVTLDAVVTNSISFTFTVATSSDCQIHMIRALLVFIDTGLWDTVIPSVIYYDDIYVGVVGSMESPLYTYTYLST